MTREQFKRLILDALAQGDVRGDVRDGFRTRLRAALKLIESQEPANDR